MPGFNNIFNDESIMFTDNVSFDGTERGGKVTTNGQLLIGATAAPHIRVNTLTAGTGVTITNGPGTITIAAGATVPIQTTEDSGTAIPSGGNLNLLGQQAGTIPVMFTTGSGSTARFEDRTWTTPFVVDPSSTVGLRGTFTTIQAAVTAAASGQIVYVRPGSYTENVTLKAGVNICALSGACQGDSAVTPPVSITGKLTATFAGEATISNIRLNTNSDNFLAVTGSSATKIILDNCFLNASNNTGISYTSSSSSSYIVLRYCDGATGSTTTPMWSMSSTGLIDVRFSQWSGAATTAADNSAGSVRTFECNINNPLSCSSTGGLFIDATSMDTSPTNSTCLTFNGTGTDACLNSNLASGSAASASIGAGATCIFSGTNVNSTNANPITGSGTIIRGVIPFTNTGNTVNTTTNTVRYADLGAYRATLQPAFSAFLGTQDNNVTGDGTVYTLGSGNALTEVFDVGNNFNTNGTFTAPITGKYSFNFNITALGLLAGNLSCQMVIVTSNRSYFSNFYNWFALATPGAVIQTMTVLADMDAADTATATFVSTSGTKVVDIQSGTDLRSSFQGVLMC